MVSALDGGDDQAPGKFQTRNRPYGLRWRETPQGTCREPNEQD
jgi:hypothetical protein